MSASESLLSLPEPITPCLLGSSELIDTAASARALRAARARRASGRRRKVDPTTTERDYSRDELEFMQAMQSYKQSSGRLFPTWSEVLEVLRDLGYIKGDGHMD
jgi:hypothetical protein